MPRVFRRPALAWTAILALGLLSVGGAGEMLSRPARSAIGAPPPDLAEAEAVRLPLPGGSEDNLSGWLVPGQPGHGVVLLLHGVRANRLEMLARARFLHGLGYTVLLVDLPAHGESGGARITYGMREGEGVNAALAFLRARYPHEKIGVVGVSLGAASLVMAQPNVALSAVVLESMFPTIREAVADRLVLYLGPLGRHLAPLLLWQLPLRLGVSPEQLQPIVDIGAMRAPVLIASGSADRHTTLAETERIYAAANAPKELWVVQGATHVDLHAFAPEAYEVRVGAFLGKYLRAAS
jgi:fermentation-respiration switch protein FrsA (DUF1100 family)